MRGNQPCIFTGLPDRQDDDCACPDKAFVLTFKEPASCENDCACPDHGLALTYKTNKPGRFAQARDIHSITLPAGFHLIFSPFAPAGPSILNHTAWQRWLSFSTPQPLSEKIDQDLAQQMLIYPAGYLPRTQATQPHTLTAWLHITNACSLDCPYCYVRKSSARMSLATGRGAIDALFISAQEHGFKRVKLKYAGGEATLHFRLVRSLHHYALQKARQTGLELREVVLSNGIHLQAEDADWLAANQIKLMISIDGVGELHNQLRPLKNRAGADTFALVADTVDQVLLPRGIRPDVTMTVTALNAHGAADVARWAMIDRDLPTSFNFYRQNLLSASHTELQLEQQALIDGMLAAYAVIEANLPTRPFLDGLLDRVQTEAHAHTCGVGQSYVVISHTGRVAQCQMYLDEPHNPPLANDLLPLISHGAIQNPAVDSKLGCQSCEFRYRCAGGCPLETYRATGRWDVQSPNCHIYKTLYPAALRLEGLRLMKVHGYWH